MVSAAETGALSRQCGRHPFRWTKKQWSHAMRSLVADERFETSDDTARLPSLPSSFVPESLTQEASPAPENPAPRVSPPAIAVLGPTLRFKGDVTAEEDFIL